MIIELREGQIYKDCDNTVAPAFSYDQDADSWRGLEGTKFSKITIEFDSYEDKKGQ